MNRLRLLLTMMLFQAALTATGAAQPPANERETDMLPLPLPLLETGQPTLDRAWRIALGDIVGNVVPYKDGLLERQAPCLMAGLDYPTPWTRDASLNTWFAAGLLMPQIMKSTLLSVLERGEDGHVRIGGQYWDCIVWTTGAWWLYQYTGDRDFLAQALDATANTLAFFETTEFDPQYGLFRGPGQSSDGIAGYPDVYAQTGGDASILAWMAHNPDKVARPGVGLPMMALSSNVLYYHAYELAGAMAAELGRTPDAAWSDKAAALKAAIQRNLWMEDAGRFRYLADPFGGCDAFDSLGLGYAILFGVADDAQARRISRTMPIQPAGLPAVWPSFERYKKAGPDAYGRHSGAIWPPFETPYALAALRLGRLDQFMNILEPLARQAARDMQFTELYHPVTGLIYGGIQETPDDPLHLWDSTSRQTWSATSYIGLVLHGLAGLRFSPEGIRFAPVLPESIRHLRITNLRYREMTIDLEIEGQGSRIAEASLNGQSATDMLLPADGTGIQTVRIRLEP